MPTTSLHNYAKKKDFVTVVDEFFVSDFLERYLQDEKNYPLTLLERQVATQISREKLKRYFVVFATFEYLSNIYFASKFYLGPGGKQPMVGEIYPPNVAAMFREIPSECKSTSRISSAQHLDKIISVYENANTEMRAYLETHQVEKSAIYRKNLIFLEKSGDIMNPERDSCSTGCFGFSPDVPFVLVNIPFYQLTLVKENNRLKIITIAPNPS